MGSESTAPPELLAEINELRCQLNEANSIISAIREGEIDALLVSEKKRDQVYILQGADHVYREIIEEMQEGYITLSKDGVILFSNRNFAQMLQTPLEQVIGRSIYNLLFPPEVKIFQQLLIGADRFQREFSLNAANGLSVPILASANFCNAGEQIAYVIITDLTEQKRSEHKFMFQVFDQAVEAIIVCDMNGQIIRVNKVATQLFGATLLQDFFDPALPLYRASDGTRFALKDTLDANISGLEASYTSIDEKKLTFLINASLLTGKESGDFLGFLVTLFNISERKQAEEELIAVNLKIAEALKAKSIFLANMSHELRTPLNAVIGFSEVLQDKLYGALNEKQETFITNIASSGRHLLSLINDVLDISKVESNKMELDLSQINLDELCQDTMTMFSEKALLKQVGLSYVIESNMDDVSIIADGRKIKQILYNLIDNGIKFNHPQGSVSITVQKAMDLCYPPAVEIVVEDTGIGITDEDQTKLFQPFSQLAALSRYDKQTEGTGLGLVLTKKLIELQGGTIILRSELGKGCRFVILLPLKQAISV
jgi:PAS domain S-box-containing protein